MKVILKRVNKPIEIIEIDKEYNSDVAKELLGDITLETVNISYNFKMYCDEEGIFKELPVNFGMWTNNPYFPFQYIHGDVVFIRFKKINPLQEIWDYTPEDITEEDIETVMRVISGEV